MRVYLSDDCPSVSIIMLPLCPVTFPIRTYIVCILLFVKVYSVVLCHCGGHFAAFLIVFVMYYLVCFCVQSDVLFDIVA